MMLTDPGEALAEQSNFVSYLVGVAGLATVVRALAADSDGHAGPPRGDDDFVLVLLGLAGLGDAIENLVEPLPEQHDSSVRATSPATVNARWLR